MKNMDKHPVSCGCETALKVLSEGERAQVAAAIAANTTTRIVLRGGEELAVSASGAIETSSI